MTFRIKKGGADALRVSTAARTAKVWPDGELIYDTDLDILYVGDGSTLGGLEASGSGGGGEWGTITGTLSDQTDLQTALDGKVDENAAIVGATKTKITYDTKGLVTAGDDATTADIAPSTNRNYVTDAEATVIGNTSGTNTGDQDLSGLATKELDNLGTTSINTDLIPDSNGAHDIGTTTLAWNKVYIKELAGTSGLAKYDVANNLIYDNSFNISIQPEQRWLRGDSGSISVDYGASELKDGSTTKLDWSGTDLDVNTRKIQNVVDPTLPQDAATKAYCDLKQTIAGLDAAVAATPAVTANTAKVTNATHTGDVSGSTVLTLEDSAITGQSTQPTITGSEYVLIHDGSSLAKTTINDFFDVQKATLQGVTDSGNTTTNGVTFNSGGTSTNDFLFGKSSITSATSGFAFDQSKGSFMSGTVGNASIGLSGFMAVGGPGTKTSQGTGSVMIGYSSSGSTLNSRTAPGAAIFGMANGSSTIEVSSTGAGSMAAGYTDGSGAAISAYGQGALAHGFATQGTSEIKTGGNGAFAQGYAYYSGTINAESGGSLALGSAIVYSDIVAGASGGGPGSFAAGFAYGYSSISAVGFGNGAFGYAYAGQDIISSADKNCFQFGIGDNDAPSSVAVGTNLRLRAKTGTPSGLRDGDIWVASGYVYIRSNGTSVKIT